MVLRDSRYFQSGFMHTLSQPSISPPEYVHKEAKESETKEKEEE